MDQAVFDTLRVVRREGESRAGCTDICEGIDGSMHICLRLNEPKCQREYLEQAGTGNTARISQGVLEVLYPYEDGVTLQSWLYERRPTLGQRRDACLSVIAQCVKDHVPPCILETAADIDNLRFSQGGVVLNYLPDWMNWKPSAAPASAVCAAARLFKRILTKDVDSWQRRWMPDELRIICIRARRGDYLDWGQLQRDVAALPQEYPSVRGEIENVIRRVSAVIRRFVQPVACIAVSLLLVAALLSLANALREWRLRESAWPGVTSVGDQELRQG